MEVGHTDAFDATVGLVLHSRSPQSSSQKMRIDDVLSRLDDAHTDIDRELAVSFNNRWPSVCCSHLRVEDVQPLGLAALRESLVVLDADELALVENQFASRDVFHRNERDTRLGLVGLLVNTVCYSRCDIG